MNLISVDTYAKLLIEICTYMYLKHVHVSEAIQAKNEIYNQTSLLFHKSYVYPFPRGPDIEPLPCQNFNWCGLCVGKVGCFDVCFIILFFSKSELKTQTIFLPNKQNLQKYFHRQRYII